LGLILILRWLPLDVIHNCSRSGKNQEQRMKFFQVLKGVDSPLEQVVLASSCADGLNDVLIGADWNMAGL